MNSKDVDEPKNGSGYSPVEWRRLRRGRRIAITATLAAVATTAAIDVGAWELGVETDRVTGLEHHEMLAIVYPLNAAVAGIIAAVTAFRVHPAPGRRLSVAVEWLVASAVAYFVAYLAFYATADFLPFFFWRPMP